MSLIGKLMKELKGFEEVSGKIILIGKLILFLLKNLISLLTIFEYLFNQIML
jgi:hypothetical protein